MSEEPTAHPFETTADGRYEVVEPMNGCTPEQLSITCDGRTWVLSGFERRVYKSGVYPDVLVYDTLAERDTGDEPYGVTD